MSVTKTSQLMLYRKIIAICSQIYTKHTNTLCGQNVEFVNVKLVVYIVTTVLQRVKSTFLLRQSLLVFSGVPRSGPLSTRASPASYRFASRW